MAEPYSYRRDAAVPAFPDDKPILVFDGHCGFCSGWARTVLRHDKAGAFRLLPAQTPLGEALYRHFRQDPDATYMVIEDGQAYVRAEASLRMARRMGLPFSLAGVLAALPKAWLDAGYDLVARNRYRFAGRTQTCMAPRPEHAARFLG